MPTTTVEVAFTTDPGATPTWTDVSAYLKQFTIHRGRADEQSAFGPGQLQLTLTNEDRRFDPSYASSPYYPNVVPMRRIRVRATYNAITYDVYNGYVTDWRQVYNPPGDAECAVEASDAFKVLGSIDLPLSVWEVEVRADSPAYWWRLDEPAGSTVIRDRISGYQAAVTGSGFGLGAAGLVSHDPGGAAAFVAEGATPYSQSGATATLTSPISAYPLTLSAIVSTTGGSGGSIISIRTLASSGYEVAKLSSDGTNVFFTTIAGGTQRTVSGTAAINNGSPHLVTGVWDAAGLMTLYVDGVSTGTPMAAAAAFDPATKILVGGPAEFGGGGFVGTIDEPAVFTSAVSSSRIVAWFSARATPWNGDLSGTRIGRILDAAGWPAADRNIDTGQAVLQSADLAQTALAALQKIEQTEQGAVFVTGAGLVRFVARDSLLKAPYTTSQGTFGDSGSELEYGDLTYLYNDSLIFNEVNVSRTGGTVQTVKDTTSQTRYLRRTKTIDGLLHRSDQTSIDLANWTLSHYKDPILRVTGLRLEPSAGNDTTHFPHVLGRELMDRVTVKRIPQNVGVAISQDTLIEGITHTVTSVQWITTWDLSPAEAQAYWILGVAGFSELGQTTRLGF